MKRIAPFLALALSSVAFAEEATGGTSLGGGLVALAAGLALGLSAIAVGLAQSKIGSAAAGTLAERPQAFGQLLIYIILPETLIIFGFLALIFLQPAVK